MPSLGFNMDMGRYRLKLLSSSSKKLSTLPSFWGCIQLQIFSTVLFLMLIYSATDSNNMQKETLLKNKYYQLVYKSATQTLFRIRGPKRAQQPTGGNNAEHPCLQPLWGAWAEKINSISGPKANQFYFPENSFGKQHDLGETLYGHCLEKTVTHPKLSRLACSVDPAQVLIVDRSFVQSSDGMLCLKQNRFH